VDCRGGIEKHSPSGRSNVPCGGFVHGNILTTTGEDDRGRRGKAKWSKTALSRICFFDESTSALLFFYVLLDVFTGPSELW